MFHGQPTTETNMLHIHCGESSAGQLRQSGVPGEVMTWCELLHQGPTPATLSGDAWREVRAEFLSGTTGGTVARDTFLRWLTDQDARLAVRKPLRHLDLIEIARRVVVDGRPEQVAQVTHCGAGGGRRLAAKSIKLCGRVRRKVRVKPVLDHYLVGGALQVGVGHRCSHKR